MLLKVFTLYLAFFCVLFWSVVFGDKSFVQPDIYSYYYPVWDLAREALRNGQVPLWNPYLGFGTPFLANPQSCLAYPFSAFWVLGDFTRGLNFYIVWHLALAAFSTYYFMRERGSSPQACWLAGFAFALSGYALSTIRLVISLASAAYFPLVLVFFLRALRRQGFLWKGMSVLALLIQYLAGDPCVTYMTLAVCLVMAASHGPKGLAVFAEVFVFFLALGAFQMLPFAEFVSLSLRGDQDFASATKWSFSPAALWEIVTPPSLGLSTRATQSYPWLSSAYAGLGVGALSLLCLRRGMRPAEKAVVLLALVALWLSLGHHGFLYTIVWHVEPFFKLIRYPERFFFLVHFSLACLAGWGLDRWLRGGRHAGLKSLVAVAFVIADLLTAHTANIPLVDKKVFETPPANVRTVREDPGVFRVMTSIETLKGAYRSLDPAKSVRERFPDELVRRWDQFFPNLTLLGRIHSLWNYESVYLRGEHDTMREFGSLLLADARPLWERWNVKYIVSPQEAIEGLEKIQTTPAGNLFRDPKVWPRAYWVSENGQRLVGADITSYENDRVRLRIDAPENGRMVLTDAYYPGWEARVDGNRTPIYRANRLFRAITLKAGAHEVEWVYRPLAVRMGTCVSLLALAILAIRMARSKNPASRKLQVV